MLAENLQLPEKLLIQNPISSVQYLELNIQFAHHNIGSVLASGGLIQVS